MRWIYAATRIAFVANTHSVGYRAVLALIHKTMRAELATPIPYLSVAAFIQGAYPDPAARFSDRLISQINVVSYSHAAPLIDATATANITTTKIKNA